MVAIFKLIISAAILCQASAAAINQRQVLNAGAPIRQYRARTATALVVGDPVLATRTAPRKTTSTTRATSKRADVTVGSVPAAVTGTINGYAVQVGLPVLAVRPAKVVSNVPLQRAAAVAVSAEAKGSLGRVVVGAPVVAVRPESVDTDVNTDVDTDVDTDIDALT